MKILASLVILAATLAAACSGSTSSSGTGTTGVSGTAALTFTPIFTGGATTAGTCPVCGPLPGVDAGGTPSGPASFQGVVVLLTDDPMLQAHCNDASYTLDVSQFHYLTVQVISTGTIAPGSYSIYPSIQQAGGSSYAWVSESRPVDGGLAGYVDDDDATGTVVLTTVGGTATGSFTASSLQQFGSGPSQGNLAGTFAAAACPALAQIAFEGPCGGCPG